MSAELLICMDCRLHIANRRGLCDWCHRRTRAAVATGKTTWAELERQGRVLPAEVWDDDAEEKPALWAELTGLFVIFGMGLVLAGAGLLLWNTSRTVPLAEVPIFAVGCGVMLLALKLAVKLGRGGTPLRDENDTGRCSRK
jgi:hypothetical protein